MRSTPSTIRFQHFDSERSSTTSPKASAGDSVGATDEYDEGVMLGLLMGLPHDEEDDE